MCILACLYVCLHIPIWRVSIWRKIWGWHLPPVTHLTRLLALHARHVRVGRVIEHVAGGQTQVVMDDEQRGVVWGRHRGRAGLLAPRCHQGRWRHRRCGVTLEHVGCRDHQLTAHTHTGQAGVILVQYRVVREAAVITVSGRQRARWRGDRCVNVRRAHRSRHAPDHQTPDVTVTAARTRLDMMTSHRSAMVRESKMTSVQCVVSALWCNSCHTITMTKTATQSLTDSTALAVTTVYLSVTHARHTDRWFYDPLISSPLYLLWWLPWFEVD